MDQKEIAKQMFQFNRTAFENTFASMAMVQDQMEKTMEVFLNQSTWLPAEGKKVMEEYVKACKTARENFKKAVDESYKKVEDFLGRAA